MAQKTEIENLMLAFTASQLNEKDVLKMGEALLRTGADELTNGGFWIWGVDTDVEFYSPKFIKTLGYNPNEVKPTPAFWQNNILPEYLDQAINTVKKHAETMGDTAYHLVVEYEHKNGDIIPILCSGQGVFNDNNELCYLIGSHKLL